MHEKGLYQKWLMSIPADAFGWHALAAVPVGKEVRNAALQKHEQHVLRRLQHTHKFLENKKRAGREKQYFSLPALKTALY